MLLAHNDQFEFDIVSFRKAYNISVDGKALNSDKALNGKTWNSAFKLQINKNNQATAKFKQPRNEAFQKVTRELLVKLNLSLQLIRSSKLPLERVSVMAIANFLQLPSSYVEVYSRYEKMSIVTY